MLLPEHLATPRLLLRRPRLGDAASILAEYAQDPEVTRYLMWRKHASINDTLVFLARCDERWKTGREMTWALTLPDADRAIGMMALRPNDHKPDVGFVLARRFWGQGLMAEAGKAIVDLAFQHAEVFRVWAVCDAENHQSARVMEKLGMQKEGVLRSWIFHPNVSSEPRDALVYARVRATP